MLYSIGMPERSPVLKHMFLSPLSSSIFFNLIKQMAKGLPLVNHLRFWKLCLAFNCVINQQHDVTMHVYSAGLLEATHWHQQYAWEVQVLCLA